MVLNPFCDLPVLNQLQFAGEIEFEPYYSLEDMAYWDLALDSEGCQCHHLPEFDMDGGRFPGHCNWCHNNRQDLLRFDEPPADWHREGSLVFLASSRGPGGEDPSSLAKFEL